jgi:hypothetical protein
LLAFLALSTAGLSRSHKRPRRFKSISRFTHHLKLNVENVFYIFAIFGLVDLLICFSVREQPGMLLSQWSELRLQTVQLQRRSLLLLLRRRSSRSVLQQWFMPINLLWLHLPRRMHRFEVGAFMSERVHQWYNSLTFPSLTISPSPVYSPAPN